MPNLKVVQNDTTTQWKGRKSRVTTKEKNKLFYEFCFIGGAEKIQLIY